MLFPRAPRESLDQTEYQTRVLANNKMFSRESSYVYCRFANCQNISVTSFSVIKLEGLDFIRKWC